MSFTTILLHSLKGNITAIKGYFLSISFSVMVFFMMSMLIHHPELPFEILNKGFQEVAQISNLIAFVFLAIFIFYSAYNYIKKRSRDYAIYKILGMRPLSLNLLFLSESIIIYLWGIITGITAGFLLEKLFFMVIAKIFDLDNINLYLPLEAVKEVSIYFITISLLISSLSLSLLKRKELKKVLIFNIQEQKAPPVNYILSLLSILLIALGYYLACTITKKSEINYLLPITLLVLSGSFLFYRQFCTFILRMLKKNKSIYYKGVNTLWISDLSFRVKDFSTVLFLTTTMMSVGLAILSVIFTVTYNKFEHKDPTYFPLTIINAPFNSNETAKEVEFLFKKHDIHYQRLSIPGLLLPQEHKQDLFFIPYSTMSKLFPEEAKKITADKEQILYRFLFSNKQKRNTNIEKIFLKGFDSPYNRKTLPPNKISASLPSLSTTVVPDAIFQDLQTKTSPITVNFFEHESAYSCGRELIQLKNKYYEENNYRKAKRFFSSTVSKVMYKYSIRLYIFISISLAFLFFICASSMLYFKFFNHLKTEGIKYGNYFKLGLSPKEIIRSSRIQMAILFFLPNILVISNTFFALVAFNNISSNFEHFITPVTKIFGIVMVIQLFYFILINNQYNRQLSNLLQSKSTI